MHMKDFIGFEEKGIPEKDVISAIITFKEIDTSEYETILNILNHRKIVKSFDYKSNSYEEWSKRIRHIFETLFDIPVVISDTIIHGRYKIVISAEVSIKD